MRILLLTQAENLYLPPAVAKVCRAHGKNVAAIIAAPPMSTHGGRIRGVMRHVRLFGVGGSLTLAGRLAGQKAECLLNGRSGRMSLDGIAEEFGLPFHRVERVNCHAMDELVDRYPADLLVSMSCPQIVGRKLRERFPRGCINVHGAVLPRYRGLMPAFWALRNGETQTGSTVHELADRLDDGDILVQKSVAISPGDTWDSLVRKTKSVGADALNEAIELIRLGEVARRPNRQQDATYYSFPGSEDRKAFLASGRRFF
jgi:methionyl-tRNA formyltransferase